MSHPNMIHSGRLQWFECPIPHFLMLNTKGREKEEKREGAKAEVSICFCFQLCSFQSSGSAKALKATASSVHFPCCNLPPGLLLTAINHL